MVVSVSLLLDCTICVKSFAFLFCRRDLWRKAAPIGGLKRFHILVRSPLSNDSRTLVFISFPACPHCSDSASTKEKCCPCASHKRFVITAAPLSNKFTRNCFRGFIPSRTWKKIAGDTELTARKHPAKMTLQAFASPIPMSRLNVNRSSACPESRQRPLAKTKRTRPRRMVFTAQTSPTSESSGDDAEEPKISDDWREFRAALIAGSTEELERNKENAYRPGHWAHSISIPETGCFLASHPAYYRRAAPYLTQAVVFITSYDPKNGAIGLVLNRPLRGNAAELEDMGMFGRSMNLSSTPLANQPIYTGGPDTIESGVLTVLHGDDELAKATSSRQPLDGVYVGDAGDVLRQGIDVKNMRFFSGCIRWGKHELEREVDDGSWYCISASKLFALEHCIQLPKPLWVEIMQSQGQPFAQIASRVYDDSSDSGESE